MKVTKHLKDNFTNINRLNEVFVGTPPFPLIALDNFLPQDLAKKMEQECNSIPDHLWTKFTRRGSYMQECVNMDVAPVANEFVNQMHSQAGMTWITALTGIKDLIPDPYLVGAGYSRIGSGSSLKIHTDFNWNETIKVHRMLSFIIYLNSNWKEEWGGHLQFNDFQNKNVIQRIPPQFNRAVFWRHHKKGFHGFPDPLTCPENITRNAFRLFFYVSNAQHDSKDLPHRSLYWFDNETGEPYDIPTEK
jgi:hypothetical protein